MLGKHIENIPQQKAVIGPRDRALGAPPLRHGDRVAFSALQDVADLALHLVRVRANGEIVVLGELLISVHLHALPISLIRKVPLHDGLEAVRNPNLLLGQLREHVDHVRMGNSNH